MGLFLDYEHTLGSDEDGFDARCLSVLTFPVSQPASVGLAERQRIAFS